MAMSGQTLILVAEYRSTSYWPDRPSKFRCPQ